ncbi:hypothetical protein WA026_010629 [Henosepilachna vigintioctopunctata]|uniref:PDZ domain-containing protein n=1 Tax=Henosepilachna vigintioctopunctata TaxID=420089 RepID=A0AAW1V5M2_9CUCU
MEIFLKRPHSQVPWGFRIIGGSDSHLPIIVSKVLENSVAEQSGLQEDLILERINNVPTCGLSHSEVNQLILAAENEILLTIKRVNLETLILATLNDEEESDSEISNILRQIINKDALVEDSKSIRKDQELEEMGLKREFETIVEPDKHRIINRNSRNLAIQPPRKKWSTFLQKPQNPTPKEKNQAPPVSKENRYKVIITKQPKKEIPVPQITIDIPTDDNEKQENAEEEHFTTSEAEQNLERQIDDFQISMENQEIVSTEIEMHNLEEIHELQENINEDLEETHEEYEEKEVLENETEIEMKDVPCEAPSLEEQLAAVQKQLQELAQLPSTIQDTLSAVTQQLANIVGSKVQENESQDENNGNECTEIEVELQEEEKEIAKLALGGRMESQVAMVRHRKTGL